jgi:hypothetical protein
MDNDLQTKPNEPEMNDSGTLTPKQIEAIPHLIGAKSIEAGCRRAKIAKATLYRWLKSDAFKSEMEKARESVIREALGRLKNAITVAVDGLVELARDKNKNVKIRACEKIIDLFLRVKEVEEIEGRLEKIESIIIERRA